MGNDYETTIYLEPEEVEDLRSYLPETRESTVEGFGDLLLEALHFTMNGKGCRLDHAVIAASDKGFKVHKTRRGKPYVEYIVKIKISGPAKRSMLPLIKQARRWWQAPLMAYKEYLDSIPDAPVTPTTLSYPRKLSFH
jgi:hypothetical protein